ncbi:hypothetical protein [Pseudoruegeria sp. SK021]|uniref:hypothetical protein n=1 Tax=Pseudoruegeria sp. SK021 TaxID=1933035 RepID=UPI000A257280|nr:hypothetical protein [Pseudoruegeria sp. SK021]OSP55562.1 hypothetical protein BV911_06755 [Pseudoruegeria sp. SK021]
MRDPVAGLTVPLSGFTLPEGSPVLRDHVRKPKRRSDHYHAAFDRRTLIYDCVWQPDHNRYLLMTPMLSNLWPTLRDGLRQNGAPVQGLRRKRMGKYDLVMVPGAKVDLSLVLGDKEYPLTQRASVAENFAGMNCAVTMNRNNPLDWITDWAAWHVALHGLQGVLIFDNGSDAYSPDELAAALAGVRGLQQVVVASAPYPYGTTDRVERGEIRPNFLQPAMLNLARTDFLRKARAVLNADFDELVMSRDGSSVFDAAVARRHLAVRLPVYWAYPDPDVSGPARQLDHQFRNDPKRRTPRKWCVAPGGLSSRFGWHVHHVGGEVFKLNRESTDHEVIHCRAASTGWNARRGRHQTLERRVPDPELTELMARMQCRFDEGAL